MESVQKKAPDLLDRPNYLIDVAAVLALVSIALSYVLVGDSSRYPSAFPLAAVLASCLLCATPYKGFVKRFLLANPVIVLLGVVSYPFYLWHWPALSFSYIIGQDSNLIRLLLVLVSLLLALLTYFLIERPIRVFSDKSRVLIPSVFTVMLLAGVVSLANWYSLIVPRNSDLFAGLEEDAIWTYPNGAKFRDIVVTPTQFPGTDKLTADLEMHSTSLYLRELKSQSTSATIYLGDSHMEQYWSRIDQLIEDRPNESNSARFFTASGFLPIPNIRSDYYRNPQFRNLAETMMQYVLSGKDFERVVITAFWSLHFCAYCSDDVNPSEVPFRVFADGDFRPLSIQDSRSFDAAMQELESMINTFQDAGMRVFLTQDIPSIPLDSPLEMIERGWQGFSINAVEIPLEQFLSKTQIVRDAIAIVAQNTGATLIDPLPSLFVNGRLSSLDKDSRAVYMNSGHLSDRWVRLNADFLDQTLLNP